MAALSSRLYKILKDIELQNIARELSGKRKSRTESVEGIEEPFKLITNFEEVKYNGQKQYVSGTISHDYLITSKGRDGRLKAIVGNRSDEFLFTKGSNFFVPFTPTDDTELISSVVDDILFGTISSILNVNVSSFQIEKFLKQNPHVIKGCNWANLDIPGLSKASLGGSNVQISSDFGRYDTHGEKRSVLVTLNENQWTVRINEDAVIVFYSTTDKEEILEFYRSKIFPLFV